MYEFKQYDFCRESISKTFMRNGIVRRLIRKNKRLDNSTLKEFNAWSLHGIALTSCPHHYFNRSSPNSSKFRGCVVKVRACCSK